MSINWHATVYILIFYQPSEEPKSWIPSYSVRSQGSSPLVPAQQTAFNADVAEIESLPEPAVEVPVPHEESPVPAAPIEAAVLEVAEPEPAPVAELASTPVVEPESTPVAVPESASAIEPVVEAIAAAPAPVIVTTADEVPEVGLLLIEE